MNPSRCSLKRVGWLILSIAIMAVIGLLVVNVVDYRRYVWAAHFDQSVGAKQVRELAKTCFALANGTTERTRPQTYPENIARLKPLWVSVGPDHVQIGLYGNGDYRAVVLSFDHENGTEVALVNDSTRGADEDRVIYVQDKAAYEILHPQHRIVTLTQWGMHDYGEWIVLPNEIRVIGRGHGSNTQVLGQSPISSDECRQIMTAAESIPASVRGRYYTNGAVDGIGLGIYFSPDGRRLPTDLTLANTWRDEVATLLELVRKHSPAGHDLGFREAIQWQNEHYPSEQTSRTWAEMAKLKTPPRAWWCLWPRFVG